MNRRLRRIERIRAELLDDLSRRPPDTLCVSPAPGVWSVLEIVEHLVLAEEEVLAGIDRPETLEARPRTVRNRISYLLVLLVLAFRIPVRVPSRAMSPRGERTLAQLRADWERRHGLLRAYVEKIAPNERSRPVFVHPVSGPITLPQALRLLEVHLRLHRSQITQRLRAAAT
ncbi:MAG: DinB family protein [Rhodothermales bacterium]